MRAHAVHARAWRVDFEWRLAELASARGRVPGRRSSTLRFGAAQVGVHELWQRAVAAAVTAKARSSTPRSTPCAELGSICSSLIARQLDDKLAFNEPRQAHPRPHRDQKRKEEESGRLVR